MINTILQEIHCEINDDSLRYSMHVFILHSRICKYQSQTYNKILNNDKTSYVIKLTD